jgi:hypothetical protein
MAARSRSWAGEIKESVAMTWKGRLLTFFPTTIVAVSGVVLAGVTAAAIASPFYNLGFESAVLIGGPTNYTLPIGQAMPGWTAGSGSLQFTAVFYDDVSTGAPAVSLQDGLSPYGFGPGMQPLQGSYSVSLQGSTGGPGDCWIAQSGDVPNDAASLLFETDNVYGGFLTVSLNGTQLTTSLFSTGQTVNGSPIETYIARVSAFAGDSDVTLKFDVATGVFAELDAISFSTVAEPSSPVLLTVAVLSAGTYVWRRTRVGRLRRLRSRSL